MFVDFLIEVFQANAAEPALIWRDDAYTYAWLGDRVRHWSEELARHRIQPGAVTILEGDFSPNAVALFLALCERGCILVPLTSTVAAKKSEFIQIAQGEVAMAIDESDEVEFTSLGRRASHPLYDQLRRQNHPGLILFSSGSTGQSKAALHDLTGLLEKFHVRRNKLRSISFLLYDHIGGVNTMLYTLSNGGCLVTVDARSPDRVLAAVDRHGVELLPTSPTFLNLVLLSEAYKRFRLQTLKTITYGTEPMPESTLKRFHELFPHIQLLQTYGLSEVGILRSKSRSSDSLWVKIGGEGFETRVVEGVLHIKARSAMLGYLNAPSPFTDDGWMNTGDAVEVDGEYLRILGRKSELINVGGEKVYPAEVETVLLEMDGVEDAAVYSEKNAILGQMVCARIKLKSPRPAAAFITDLKKFCAGRLQPFKVPVRIQLVETSLHSGRFKKMRRDG